MHLKTPSLEISEAKFEADKNGAGLVKVEAKPWPLASLPLQASTKERRMVAREYEAWLKLVLPTQCRDGSANDGGFEGIWKGWYEGRHTAFLLAQLIAAHCWNAEISCPKTVLEDSIHRALAFIRRRQDREGRLEFLGAYSENEVGFPMSGLAESYRRLMQLEHTSLSLPGVCADLKDFLLRGAEAVLKGSAATANHRWAAACAPLAAVHSLWPDPRYLAKIEDYLSDGIDCNKDGCWYEERSPNYNMVANMGLMIMSDYLDRPELLQTVVRNLRFVLHCIQPNGEADSSFSHRQDRGKSGCLPAVYGVARRGAQVSGDGQLTSLAHAVWRQSKRNLHLMPLPFELDRHPAPMPEKSEMPTSYERHFALSSLVRVRDGECSLTLAADPGGHFYDTVRDQWGGPKRSEDWIHLQCGDLVIESIHLAGASMGSIQPSSLATTAPGRYQLKGFSPGWTHSLHFRPGNKPHPMVWDWSHSIQINLGKRELELDLESASPSSLVASLRIWIRPGVFLQQGDSVTKIKAGKTISLAGENKIVLFSKTHKMEITGLPTATHRVPLEPKATIPSAVSEKCGCLSLGLLFPLKLKLKFVWMRI